MKLTNILSVLCLVCVAHLAQAADLDKFKTELQKFMPVKIDSITPFANTGLFEVVLEGSEVVYFTEDLKYGFQGSIIEMNTGTNLTEAKKIELRKTILANVKPSELITYSPKNKQYSITVFTDIDCGYCRKLHNEIASYNDLGIEVNYMAFPRAGLDSESFNKAEAVWCAKDPQKALTDAKKGIKVTSKQCNSPVAAQYELGGKIGVEGTPAIFLENGEVIPGYVPAQQLQKILQSKLGK